MLMQLQKYIYIILQRLWRTVQDDTFERSYTKVPFLFRAPTAGSLLVYPYVYKYMILVSSELDRVCRGDQNHVRCIFAFNF